MTGEKSVFFFFKFSIKLLKRIRLNDYIRTTLNCTLLWRFAMSLTKCWLEFSLVIKVRRWVWLLKCYKNTFLYSIFFYLKTIYIYIQSKKYFCCVRILSFKENIFVLNQNILLFKNSYIQPEFFSYKKYIFIHTKKMCSMKLFYSMIFGSQIWSSIC